MTKEIAECVYTALITDTGSFHYSNTTERTFKVASELVRTGVKPAKTAEAVFASYPWSRIQLMGAVLSTARRDSTGPRGLAAAEPGDATQRRGFGRRR